MHIDKMIKFLRKKQRQALSNGKINLENIIFNLDSNYVKYEECVNSFGDKFQTTFVVCFLAYLSCSDKVSFCDHILSVVRPCVRASVHQSVNNFFKRHLLLNH